MKIKGIQKITLIDYPNKIACTLFLFGCNFKCGFCHNPELVMKESSKDLDEKDILEFLNKRKDKLEGICITGGEPLLTLEKNFLKKIKEIGYLIKIDTNGSCPEKLKEIINEKLVDFIAMDIKSCKEDYEKVCSCKIDLQKIEESIKLIVDSDLDYEFRTTIVPDLHNKENIIKLSEEINKICSKPKKYCLQAFTNSGKFINTKYENEKNVSEKFLEEIKEAIKDYFEEVEIRV